MNIANVVFSFNTGGIENLLVDTINNWFVDDKILLLIINDSFNQTLIDRIQPKSNVRVVLLKRAVGGSKVRYIRDACRALSEFKPDVIHFHNNSVFKFCLAYKLLHPSVISVLTVHDTRIYGNLSWVDRMLHRLFLNRIVAISQSVAIDIENKAYPKNRIAIVYNGIDSEKFKPDKKRENDVPVIMCVARLVPEKKGQDLLIRAVAKIAEEQRVKCFFVGEAPQEKPACRDEIEGLIKELRAEDYVRLLGNRDNVPDLLAAADVFVLPSRNEGFGLALVEAMMSKVPVIASSVDGPKEILRDGAYGKLFESGNSVDLERCLREALAEDSSVTAEKAYDYAIKNYDISVMVKRLRDVYCSQEKIAR